MIVKSKITGKPFLKWAGGKGQLLPQLEAALPKILFEEEFTYIEPFVGGGAMLFFMLQKFSNIKRVIINDINANLIGAYKTIKACPEDLVCQLEKIEQQFMSIAEQEDRRAFYLEMRRQFNEDNMTTVDKTAILIFLNRTCFNGLYRENAKGFFNVPFGRYIKPTICNKELIYADSELLNKFDVQIMTGDFKQTVKHIENNITTFFYFDPPYRPLSSTSSFNTYVKEEFGDEEQKNLAYFCQVISLHKNVFWMLSNSDCSAKNPKDTFFEDIYSDFNIKRLSAFRAINANPYKRGKLTELLISNYNTRDYKTTKREKQQLSKQVI